MRNELIDAFARQADAILSRRETLLSIGLGVFAAISSAIEGTLAKNGNKKKRRRKRRRKKRKKQKSSSPPTCAEQCSEAFEVCLDRAADSTLCGDTFSTACRGCFSDQDCVETDTPYCLNVDGVIIRATEEPSSVLRSICGPFLSAVCAGIII